jgi:hypothetical protein
MPNVHDAFFRAAFSNPESAAARFRQYLRGCPRWRRPVCTGAGAAIQPLRQIQLRYGAPSDDELFAD